MIALLDKLKDVIPRIYDEIIDFSIMFKEDNLDMFKTKRPVNDPLKQQGKDGNGKKGKSSSDRQDNTTSEEKNTFALNVVRRVRFKLEGREPDALKKASVQEQVDFVIREATSADNLALMYEGWTSWI